MCSLQLSIADKDAEIDTLKATIVFKDAILAEKDASLVEKDAELSRFLVQRSLSILIICVMRLSIRMKKWRRCG